MVSSLFSLVIFSLLFLSLSSYRKSKKGTIFLVRKKDGVSRAQMAMSFDKYKEGKPGLLEKLGVWENRRNQNNPYR